jgi:hypothetical protein
MQQKNVAATFARECFGLEVVSPKGLIEVVSPKGIGDLFPSWASRFISIYRSSNP